jgi:hypothetical protein
VAAHRRSRTPAFLGARPWRRWSWPVSTSTIFWQDEHVAQVTGRGGADLGAAEPGAEELGSETSSSRMTLGGRPRGGGAQTREDLG